MRTPTTRFLGVIAALALVRSVAFAQGASSEPRVERDAQPFLIHVKTSLGVDDAQICVVPNVAWAALEAGSTVTLLFDGSAVTSVARGRGWRGWLGSTTTAMDRAPLPERERRSLAEQFGVPLETVPEDYGAYLRFLKEKGVAIYYNTTMALLYRIDPEDIDPALTPMGLKDMVELLSKPAVYLVY